MVSARHVIGAALVATLAACSNLQSGATAGLPAAPALPAHRGSAPVIREFDDLMGKNSYYYPRALAYGPGGDLWIADNYDPDFGTSAIVRVSTSGRHVASYPTGSTYAGIAAGPDGAVWVADTEGYICRLRTDGSYTSYFLHHKYPNGIAPGPDAALWFTATSSPYAYIGRITTSGHVTMYKGVSRGAFPVGIATGSDGNLWFTEEVGNRIGRITTAGVVTEFGEGIGKDARPYAIAAGSDGALWFTEIGRGGIGRITTSGQVTEYRKGISRREHPFGIALGPDGAMWFTEYGPPPHAAPAKIGRIATDGTIAEYSDIRARSFPQGIVEGPRGVLWFVEESTDLLGRVRL